MLLLYLYIVVLLITVILFYFSRKEGFSSVTIPSSETTPATLVTTSSSIETMNEIDFSEIENSEKTLRDEKSKELNNCIGKYVNRKVQPLRDVSEIMFSEVEDCDNIFETTEVDSKKKYFEQMEFW